MTDFIISVFGNAQSARTWPRFSFAAHPKHSRSVTHATSQREGWHGEKMHGSTDFLNFPVSNLGVPDFFLSSSKKLQI